MRLECTENEKTNSINVLMGVFIDGFDNINHNVEYYKDPKGKIDWTKQILWDGPIESNYSNVAHIYNAYKHTFDGSPVGEFDYIRRVYVSGFNKSEYEGSRKITSTLTVLKAEFTTKVKQACEKIYKDLGFVISHASESFPINQVKLSLDVYGVGKGAAVARCFANNLYNLNGNIKDKKVSLDSYWMEQIGYLYSEEEKIDVSVDIRFLGLYDTVSSYGEYGDNEKFNDVLDLGLDCGESSPVVKGVHFCAADEYRTKYPLVTTDSFDENMNQYIFPGSHFDIGGGDKKNVIEHHDNQFFKYARRNGNRLSGFREIPEFVKDGWFSWSQDSEGNLIVESSRNIVNTYSLVFLFLMLSQSMKCGYDYLLDHNSLKVAKKILSEDKFLGEVQKRVGEVVDGSPLYSIYGQNKCKLGETDLECLPRFREGDPDGKIVRMLRGRYVHLPSNLEIDPITKKIKNRTILKG